jgi:DNA mismatch endonuclease (patch repair protein)
MPKSKNTYPELIAQKIFNELGITYSKHVKDLPGTPDIVIEEFKIAIFVHGCFWHKHSCQEITKEDESIVLKDIEVINETITKGYKPIILWECDLTNNQLQAKEKLRYLIEKLSTHSLAPSRE